MRRYSNSKDINRAVNDLVREGWTPIRRKRHFQILSPCGDLRQTIPGSPGDFRSFIKFRHDVNRIKEAMIKA
jgi:hypothetical protein